MIFFMILFGKKIPNLIHKKIYKIYTVLQQKLFTENCLKFKFLKLLSQNYVMLLLVLEVHKVILITISPRYFFAYSLRKRQMKNVTERLELH